MNVESDRTLARSSNCSDIMCVVFYSDINDSRSRAGSVMDTLAAPARGLRLLIVNLCDTRCDGDRR